MARAATAEAVVTFLLVLVIADWWAYLVAPVIGGAVAVTLYDRFLGAGRSPA
jgi:glycerol uptake facilitator-like aquaporin